MIITWNTTLNNLNINDIYYFVSDKEKYLIKQAYISLIKNIEIIEKSLISENFNRNKEKNANKLKYMTIKTNLKKLLK